jgi:hypothetical protein
MTLQEFLMEELALTGNDRFEIAEACADPEIKKELLRFHEVFVTAEDFTLKTKREVATEVVIGLICRYYEDRGCETCVTSNGERVLLKKDGWVKTSAFVSNWSMFRNGTIDVTVRNDQRPRQEF